MSDEENIEEVGDRIERLLEQIHSAASPLVTARVDELVHLIVDLYGAGLARIVSVVQSHDPGKNELRERFVKEPLIASLLVLHGLHPEDLRRRIERALDEVRPYLGSHAGDVEVLAVEGSVARLRLKGNCDGCPSSTTTIKLRIEEAIRKAAPEILTIEVEGHDATAEAAPPLVHLKRRGT